MKSEAQKKLEGTLRDDRPATESLNSSFPELEAIQKCPDYFNDMQARHYDRICRLLFESGLLKRVDQLALEQLAVAFANFEHATKMLNDGTPLNKYEQLSGWYTMQRDSMKIIDSFSRRFGLSISDRSKLRADSGKTEGQTDLFEQHTAKLRRA